MAQNSIREIKEGDQEQGVDESIAWIMAVPSSMGAPSSVTTVKVFSYNQETQAYTDTTSTNMPTGSASISGQNITLPALTALTEGTKYRVECKFVIGGNTVESYMVVQCRR